MCLCLSDCCLVLISVLFPPLPVWIRRGFCSCDSLINVLLCLLGYVPGLIHSWYIIAKYPPYSVRTESKIYYVYRDLNNLESGRGGNRDHCCNRNDQPKNSQRSNITVQQEPSPILSMEAGSSASASYGAINDNSGSSTAPATAPPAYSELDNKVQR